MGHKTTPTHHEITKLITNNLFKLQTDELVETCTSGRSVHDVVLNCKTLLESMDSIDNVSVPSTAPYPVPPSNLTFSFRAPTVSVVGSTLLDARLKNGLVDLALEMSVDLFSSKDFLHSRYFFRRSVFLSIITSKLSSHYHVKYELFNADPLRPILLIESDSSPVVIRLIPFLDSSFFNRKRLAPWSCNLRSDADDTKRSNSPIYNASILADSYLVAHASLLHSHLSDAPHMSHAIILGKIWINQRGFNSKVGYGFNGFLLSMIMAWLMRVNGNGFPRLSPQLSSYQLLKAVFNFIATFNFVENPLFLTDNGVASHQDGFSAKDFGTAYDVAIVDPTGTYNLVPRMTRSAMEEIQYEARLAIEFLSDSSGDRFSDLFLKKVDKPWLKYDNVFIVPQLTKAHFPLLDYIKEADQVSISHYVLSYLHRVLRTALSDRAKVIAITCDPPKTWDVNQPPPLFDTIYQVTIGLVLDPEHCLRQVEHGPPSENLELVKQFKEIWGPRSETRRFQDGSIQEAVVFSCDGTLEQRSMLAARMIAFLLSRHAHVDQDDGVTYWAGLGNKYLKSFGSPPVVNTFQSVMDAFLNLSKQLKALDLPLAMYRLVPQCDSLSYCSALIPQPISANQLVSRAHVPSFLIEFETSSKWPDDINAIESMKKAFYIRIHNLLSDSDSETAVDVCVDQENVGYLRFYHTSGHIFTAQIHHPRVGYLLKQALKPQLDPVTNAEIQKLSNSYTRSFVNLPDHYTQLGNLCLRYQFLGQTIRLVKRWMASHLLLQGAGTGISPQILEILCVRVFKSPTAFGPPASGWTGFVRVLELLESFSWSTEPLLVELESGCMTNAIQQESLDRFTKLAEGGKDHIAMFIATELDPNSIFWDSLEIPVKVVERTVVLARTCLQYIQQQLLRGKDNNISQLFVAPSDGYHAIIHLDPQMLLSYLDNISVDLENAARGTSEYKNVINSHDKQLLVYSYLDPVRLYVEKLTANFGDIALFFYDVYGGDKVAVVWKKAQLGDQKFKVNMNFNVQPGPKVR